MSGFLRHIQALNRHNPAAFRPFWVAGELVGRVRAELLASLLDESRVFSAKGAGLTLNPDLHDYVSRTQAMAEVLPRLLAELEAGEVLGEPYPVTPAGPAEALMAVDRVAAPLFGLRTFGQHLNGLVQDGEQLFMWLGRRSADRKIHPGKLDQLVAGGLPTGCSAAENLAKECWEEAGIAEDLAARAKAVGMLSYNLDTQKGYKFDVLYCYDLYLPQDFQPGCQDGEVESFRLLPVEEVMEIVSQSDDFKPNCNLVVVDFLLRHGYLGPEHPDYLEIASRLRPSMIPIETNE